jgi:hypothetical protein
MENVKPQEPTPRAAPPQPQTAPGNSAQHGRRTISRECNKHLQRTLIEAAKLASRWNAELAVLHAKEITRGSQFLSCALLYPDCGFLMLAPEPHSLVGIPAQPNVA